MWDERKFAYSMGVLYCAYSKKEKEKERKEENI
jgi:hypothetical protein